MDFEEAGYGFPAVVNVAGAEGVGFYLDGHFGVVLVVVLEIGGFW